MSRQNLQRMSMTGVLAVAMLSPAPSQAQSWSALSEIESGTTVQVRTTEMIESNQIDGRVYTATIENDVMDTQGRLAIPRGATAELVVRRTAEKELVLDLDSITINKRRYGVDATRNQIGTSGARDSGIGVNKETARNVGGGAALGAILGAIIGGGDGAAAGAVAGAAVGAGAQILTRGSRVSVPAETVLNYRLQSPLEVDVRDTGFDREGHHYHRYEN